MTSLKLTAADLRADANPLAPHYARFRVAQTLRLTGHSHQAWPDRAELGLQRAWADAADYVDGKWERAFERAEQVRLGYARLLETPPDQICLGANTHELLVRWLSALPLVQRPRIVTTDAEFLSARRQLQRLAEIGIEVVYVPASPALTVGERLARALDDRTAAAITSSVFYDSGQIAGGLAELARSCERHGSELWVDVYHHLNVLPCSLSALGLTQAYVVGGGYKYCQLGEGNAFLRSPASCTLRPVATGWYAEFDALESGDTERVAYGSLRTRFAGATYDPTSHYRAAEVFGFFAEQGLQPGLLREVSQRQVGLLRAAFDALSAPPDVITRSAVPLEQVAGFLALQTPHAANFQRALADRGVTCDARGQVLRLGPAPYLSELQLRDAMRALAEVITSAAHSRAE